MNAKNPNDITKRLNIDISRMFNRCCDLPHKSKLKRGERTNKTEGIPMIKCNLRGNGNTAAPAIDNE
jgi:hypothetical protein